MNIKLLLLLLCLLSVGGCSVFKSDNHTVVAATMTIRQLATQIDRLEANGVISKAEESEYLNRLLVVNDQLRVIESLLDKCVDDCDDAESLLLLIDSTLSTIESDLRVEQ